MSEKTNQKRVFLAHAREDKPRVRSLYDQLQRKGFAPWLDEVDLIPGQNWKEAIKQAIKEATVCLVCLSKHSVNKTGYVQNEIRQALVAYAQRPPGSIYLIPVWLDDCEGRGMAIPDLGVSLDDLHWVEMWKDDGFEKLVGAIEYNLRISRGLSQKETIDNRLPFPDLSSYIKPSIMWCSIPEGNVQINNKWDKTSDDNFSQHYVGSFHVAKYPITNEQIANFILNKNGLRNREWWPQLGDDFYDIYDIEDRYLNKISEITKKNPALVTKYLAVAFCRWITHESMYSITVPSEPHWQRAAAGDDSRAYPWGDKFDPTRCNSGLSGIGRLTPVDRYPHGRSPYGVCDLSGNACEWCFLSPSGADVREYFEPQPWHPRNASFEDPNPENFRCDFRGTSIGPPDRCFEACFRLCIPSSTYEI